MSIVLLPLSEVENINIVYTEEKIISSSKTQSQYHRNTTLVLSKLTRSDFTKLNAPFNLNSSTFYYSLSLYGHSCKVFICHMYTNIFIKKKTTHFYHSTIWNVILLHIWANQFSSSIMRQTNFCHWVQTVNSFMQNK